MEKTKVMCGSCGSFGIIDGTRGINPRTILDENGVHEKVYLCNKCVNEFYTNILHDLQPMLIAKNSLVETATNQKPIPRWLAYRYICGITGEAFFEEQTVTPGKCIVFGFTGKRQVNYHPRFKTSIKICPSCGITFYNTTLKAKCQECSEKYPLVYNATREIDGAGRTVGVEIECEPTKSSQDLLFKWKNDNGEHLVNATKDGSLRGKFPCEFTSPILHESNFAEWVDQCCDRLDARVYSRCGLHIHLGTGDMSWHEIRNIAVYCAIHERDFFSLVSKSREDGRHGVGSGLPLKLKYKKLEKCRSKDELMYMLYGATPLGIRDIDGACPIKLSKRANDQDGPRYHGLIHRYSWLNIHGHFFKRAIEVRIHQGTTNKEKIKNWIALWMHLLPIISDHRYKYHKIWDLMPEDLKCYYRNRSIVLHSMEIV